MVLPRIVFFPHSLIPLHIFEPRYRVMLQQALAGHRMFALCQAVPADYEQNRPIPAHTGGIGLIRACVQNRDGTSNLILQGLHRVHFQTFTRTQPYYTGRPLPVCSQGPLDLRQAKALAERVLKTVHDSPQYRERLPEELFNFLSSLQDYNTLVDVVAGSFIHCTQRKQRIIESIDVEQRLGILADSLQAEQSLP